LEQLSLWKEFAVSQGRVLPAVIHVDTGMNRLGVSVQELTDCLPSSATIDGLSIKFLMSHLACADEPEHSLNTKQLAQMELVRERWPKLPLSFVNSYGVYLSENYHFDIARPGMALYGMNPMPYGKNPMCSVVSWMSSIVQVREIDTPQSVGYGATYQLDAGSVIATVPVGYADGLLRYLGNRGQCSIDGYKVPIVGRVSMDLITVDITALPKQNHKSGVAVEIMGEHQTVDELACSADTIGYEVLTRLGSRLEKRYKGGK
jgi:alanine racemase